MKIKTQNSPISKQVDAELKHYFSKASHVKCPSSMKKNLYNQIEIAPKISWTSPKLAITALSFVLITSLVFKVSNDHSLQQIKINQAHSDLQIAMHYMNRVSLKSLTAVNNKGIKPALIMPLAKSVASM